MQRLDKTIQLLPELQKALTHELTQRYVWLVITEGWCGDAAQIVPVLEAVAQASHGTIATRYVLRDDNLDLMDRYLTNGGRSIPNSWCFMPTRSPKPAPGARAQPRAELFSVLRRRDVSYEDFATQLHGWYAKTSTLSTQRELLALHPAAVAFSVGFVAVSASFCR